MLEQMTSDVYDAMQALGYASYNLYGVERCPLRGEPVVVVERVDVAEEADGGIEEVAIYRSDAGARDARDLSSMTDTPGRVRVRSTVCQRGRLGRQGRRGGAAVTYDAVRGDASMPAPNGVVARESNAFVSRRNGVSK
jgi:hypothetical protein